MPKVLNKSREIIPKDAVYIGRGSKWGNPFSYLKDSKAEFPAKDRDDACDRYEIWFCSQIDLIDSLDELRGKDLVCYCSPKRCHGEFLLKLANL